MMNDIPQQITVNEWDQRYRELVHNGLIEPSYGGSLTRHIDDGDFRLLRIKFDNSSASLNLWNFLLTEEERLQRARDEGKKIIGTMKDLGTVPVMIYSLPNAVAFYPDGAWWIPCVMELSDGLLTVADNLGIDASFCPVRAMLGAFVTEAHYPIPDLCMCSVGATCDDFSAIAQRLAGMGYPIMWWEIPHRRAADVLQECVPLPGGFTASRDQIVFVSSELQRIRKTAEELAGITLTDTMLQNGITVANRIRSTLHELRQLTFTAPVCPLPALELLIAEMLAIHYCSNRDETLFVLSGLLHEVKKRIQQGVGFFGKDAARIFWVNPVADIQVMNTLEECGGRLCGTEYLFSHALDMIPTNLPPIEALAQMVLADPMVGSTDERAQRICRDALHFGSEAVVISKIPGASHCAAEGMIIGEVVKNTLGLPVLEIEVPPVSDSFKSALRTRLEALIETVKERRIQSI